MILISMNFSTTFDGFRLSEDLHARWLVCLFPFRKSSSAQPMASSISENSIVSRYLSPETCRYGHRYGRTPPAAKPITDAAHDRAELALKTWVIPPVSQFSVR